MEVEFSWRIFKNTLISNFIRKKEGKPTYCKSVPNVGVASDNIILQDRLLILKTAIYKSSLC